MADHETIIDVTLKSAADTSGAKQMDEAILKVKDASAETAAAAEKAGDEIKAVATATEEVSEAAGHAGDALDRFTQEAAAGMEALQSTIDATKKKLEAPADPGGVQQMHAAYDDLFGDIKKGVVDALSGQGVDSKFISHVVDEFDRLNKELKETGASGDEVVAKIAKMEQGLVAAAAAEEKRIRQLKVNFEMALHEKDVQEEAATLQRIRRSEDQLAMEAEGRLLKENTEKLEQEIMVRLKAERTAREAAESTKATGAAMQGVKRDIGGAAMQAAYFFDDMQYGLRGIMNNIPQVLLALGLGGGLTGIVSIAAVAVNLLWEKFGGAQEAKQETDKVTESVSQMEGALKRVSEAAEKAYKADLSTYTADVEKATGAWEQAATTIQKIIGYHNELAAVQNKIANSQLEIERQNALAGADTDAERKAVNTKFDARKAAVNDASDIEKAKRELDAEQAKAEMLKRQNSNVHDQKDDAEGRVGEADQAQQEYAKRFGGMSDQGRQVQAYDEAEKQRAEALERMKKLNAPGATMESTGSYEGEYEELESKLEELHNAIAKEVVGIEEARRALESGEGLSFDKLKGDAEKAKKSEDPEEKNGAPALSQALQAAADIQKEIDAKRKAAEEALIKTTEELTKIREAQVESEKQQALKKLQLQAAELKDSEDFAKAGTAKVTADKEADAKLRKEQAEEQARKYENDAREAEQRGDLKGAEKLRRKAEEAKLPDDVTPEQRRKMELDQRQREKAAKGGPEPVVDASSVTEPLANMARNIGPAGAALAKAVEQMREGGATAKEMGLVIQHVQALAPMINQRFDGHQRQIAALEKALNNLIAQTRSQRL